MCAGHGTTGALTDPPVPGWLKQRFVMAFMLLLAVLNIYTMRTCLSVAIVQMATSIVHNSTYEDPYKCHVTPAANASGGGASSPEQVGVLPHTLLHLHLEL